MSAGLSVHVQGVHLCKEAIIFMALLFLMMPISGLQIDLDQPKNGVTRHFMLVATSWSFFNSFSFYFVPVFV